MLMISLLPIFLSPAPCGSGVVYLRYLAQHENEPKDAKSFYYWSRATRGVRITNIPIDRQPYMNL